MFSLDKLPPPLRAAIASLPGSAMITLFSILNSFKDSKVEDVPVAKVTELVEVFNVQNVGRAVEVLTAHMARNPKDSLSEWFEKASSEGVIESALTSNEDILLHRCYFCEQPNEIKLS